MRCPICNAKMQLKTYCPYCKIYANQVIYSSNIEAKKSLKKGLKDEVTLSSTRPYDVNKRSLLLITIFLGLFGVHNYVIGRKSRGIVFNIGVSSLVLFSILLELNQKIWKSAVAKSLLEFFSVFGIIIGLLWIADIFAVAFGYFKIPIKLATIEEVKLRERKYE